MNYDGQVNLFIFHISLCRVNTFTFARLAPRLYPIHSKPMPIFCNLHLQLFATRFWKFATPYFRRNQQFTFRGAEIALCAHKLCEIFISLPHGTKIIISVTVWSRKFPKACYKLAKSCK